MESFPLNLFAVYVDPHATSIFSPFSTPSREIDGLSHFVLAITLGIFLVMSILLVYVITRYRARPGENSEPPQVFGSLQIELSWTIIPILIIVVLFLSTARVLFSIQDAPKPATALDVVVTGHQFWWEFQYPQYGVVTANELHLPLSTPAAPRPAFMKLMSADVIHSFWVPELNGKTDLVPNKVNEMWIDPQKTGPLSWGNVHSSAGRSTQRCCFGFMSTHRSNSSSGSPASEKLNRNSTRTAMP